MHGELQSRNVLGWICWRRELESRLLRERDWHRTGAETVRGLERELEWRPPKTSMC